MNNIFLILVVILFTNCNSKNTSNNQTISDSITESIDNYVSDLTQEDEFSGAILIAKNGNVLLKKAFGYAHIGFQVPNNIHTKFANGSIGKSFTAVAIFQLIESGQLSLNDNVGKYLDKYPNKTIRDSVTIKHLLTHTSGVPNYFGNKKFLEGSKDLFRTIDDLSPLYENEPMESKPRKGFAYRNSNYILLGRIIEKNTGQAYDGYIDEKIFQVAKMNNTGNYDIDHPIKNAAEGYTASNIYPDHYKINVFTSPVKGSAAGGGYSNLEDLFNFSQAFKNNKLLNEAHTTIMKTPIGKEEHYGYGMNFPISGSGNIYGHSGGHFGIGCEWRVFEKEDYTVILLTNRDADKGFLEV